MSILLTANMLILQKKGVFWHILTNKNSLYNLLNKNSNLYL